MTDRTDYMRRVIGVERAAYERDGNPHGNPLHVWSAYCALGNWASQCQIGSWLISTVALWR